MKKYYGGYEITKAMNNSPVDYIKITSFLSLINVPMEINERGVNTYVLTEEQVKYLKKTIKNLRRVFKK
jgi:hypothetical protein